MQHKEEAVPLNPGSSVADDSEEDVESLSFFQRRRYDKSKGYIKSTAAIVGFVSCILGAGYAGAYISRTHANLDGQCAAHTTQWSPLLDDVNIQYSTQEFDGDFMNENIYRRPGSPEVDAAWEALGVDYRAGVISYEDGLASGLDPSFVQRADKYGGGFFVNVEGMHHLHCLNLLRKSLYFNYDHYKEMGMHAFKNDDHILQLHVTHCLDTIRQVLMCNVDTGVLGQVWSGADKPTAFPDFNTQHTCKNYDAVREWAEKLQAAPVDELPEDYMANPKPEDVLPHTP